jgi:hypothetical protein
MSAAEDNPNSRQVGGTHYQASIQHWDFVELNGLGYLEGVATKYITRARRKHANPQEDLQKAIHYLEKLRALFWAGHRKPKRNKLVVGVADFCTTNLLNPQEEAIIRHIALWKEASDLTTAISLIQELLKKAM